MILVPPTSIRTARLALRPPRPEDRDEIFRYACDPEVTRFLSWPTHRSRRDTETFLANAEASWNRATDFAYAVEQQGRVIGGTGLTPIADDSCGSSGPAGADRTNGISGTNGPTATTTLRMGYVLARQAWGQGLATELVQALTQTAFAIPSIVRVEAFVHPENTGSIRVLEKCGFASESLAPRCGVLPNLDDGKSTPAVFTYVRLRNS